MRRTKLIVATGLVVGLVAAFASAQDQTKLPVTLSENTELQKRIIALEQRVGTLEQQNAELRRFITVSGGNTLAIKAPAGVSLEAGTTLKLRGAASAVLESSAITQVKGGMVRLNGGAKPVAHLGDIVVGANPGKIAQGSPTVFSD